MVHFEADLLSQDNTVLSYGYVIMVTRSVTVSRKRKRSCKKGTLTDEESLVFFLTPSLLNQLHQDNKMKWEKEKRKMT